MKMRRCEDEKNEGERARRCEEKIFTTEFTEGTEGN